MEGLEVNWDEVQIHSITHISSNQRPKVKPSYKPPSARTSLNSNVFSNNLHPKPDRRPGTTSHPNQRLRIFNCGAINVFERHKFLGPRLAAEQAKLLVFEHFVLARRCLLNKSRFVNSRREITKQPLLDWDHMLDLTATNENTVPHGG
jgi:hypothetical protein